jgi:hypothetical protein
MIRSASVTDWHCSIARRTRWTGCSASSCRTRTNWRAPSNNCTASYAKCLVAASPQDQLVEPIGDGRDTKAHGLDPEDLSRIRSEMTVLERDFKMVQEEYGQNMLNLVVVLAYVRRLLDNTAVVRYLSRTEAAMLAEFQQIVDTSDMRATG